MIDKIYILNLPAEQERLKYCRDRLLDRNVPKSRIAVWAGKSGSPYGKSRELCEAAADDGFEFFQKVLNAGIHNECYIGYLSQAWNYMRFWRHLIEVQETAILIHDDAMFLRSWRSLCDLFRKLPDDLLMLVLPHSIEEDMKDATGMLLKNLRGNSCQDHAVLYTPAGAEYILERTLARAEFLQLGWIGNLLWTDPVLSVADGVYTLVVKPPIVRGIIELAYASSLHDRSGKVIRSIESTRD